jgi:shikimate dehydrogenase
MSNGVQITGATRLYAIVGDPIAQVRSPQTITARFVADRMNAILIPAHVPVERFDDVMAGLLALGNLDGVIATVPFKARIIRYVDSLGRTAQLIGALNVMRREADGSWSGDMFDGVGFVRGAERKGERVRGRRVALFGAGGAGSAIACELAAAGVASIDIIDVQRDRADALAAKLAGAFADCRLSAAASKPADADMVVNASPIGMRPGDGMPADIGPLGADMLVGDVIVSESPTPIIRHAMRCGCRWVDGNEMHAGQIDAIANFFESASRARR